MSLEINVLLANQFPNIQFSAGLLTISVTVTKAEAVNP